jgi:hypothetical protein
VLSIGNVPWLYHGSTSDHTTKIYKMICHKNNVSTKWPASFWRPQESRTCLFVDSWPCRFNPEASKSQEANMNVLEYLYAIVCMCVYIFVYVYVYVYVCIYIYACMHLYAFVYICMRLCMHLLSTKWVCTSTSTASMHFVEKQVSDTWSILKPRNTIPHQELSPDSPREQPMLQRDCCK